MHLITHSNSDGPDFSKDDAFKKWWVEQDFGKLRNDLDDDPDSQSAFGYRNLNPRIVRVLKAYNI